MATRTDVAFMVVISPSVVTVAEARAMQVVDQAVTRDGSYWEEFAGLWRDHAESPWFRRVYLGDAPMAPDDPYRVWYRTALDIDPVPYLEQVDVPMLWLFGDPTLDRFGPVARSVERLHALAGAGKLYSIHVYEGADHNLNPSRWEDDLATWVDTVVLRHTPAPNATR